MKQDTGTTGWSTFLQNLVGIIFVILWVLFWASPEGDDDDGGGCSGGCY